MTPMLRTDQPYDIAMVIDVCLDVLTAAKGTTRYKLSPTSYSMSTKYSHVSYMAGNPTPHH